VPLPRHGVPLPIQMTYDAKKHHRRSVRLKGYDYASPGWYYLTICTHDRNFLFGEIVESQMRPSRTGEIAQKCWNEIPRHCPRTTLDVSIVMPNHLHGIIVIGGGTPSERTGTPSERTGTPWRAPTKPASSPGRDTPWRVPTAVRREAFGKPVPGSLATLLRLFKQAVTVQARAQARAYDGVAPEFVGARHGVPLQVWQENFFEHIIRNEKELNRIREYICNNPLRWLHDSENPARDPEAVDEIEDILGSEDDSDQ